MSRGLVLEQAAADHREAVTAVAADVERFDASCWETPPRPGKWCPAEVAQHLTLAYEAPMRELAGGPGYRPLLSWWMQRVARWVALGRILDGGRFPAGAKSPPEARPSGPYPPPGEAAARLRDAAAAFERAISEAHRTGRGRISHPYFGPLTAPQALELVARHAEHHRKQLHEGGA